MQLHERDSPQPRVSPWPLLYYRLLVWTVINCPDTGHGAIATTGFANVYSSNILTRLWGCCSYSYSISKTHWMLQTFPPPAPDALGLTWTSLPIDSTSTLAKPTGAELGPGQHGREMELYCMPPHRIVLASTHGVCLSDFAAQTKAYSRLGLTGHNIRIPSLHRN